MTKPYRILVFAWMFLLLSAGDGLLAKQVENQNQQGTDLDVEVLRGIDQTALRRPAEGEFADEISVLREPVAPQRSVTSARSAQVPVLTRATPPAATQAKVPVLHKIPVLGRLFRRSEAVENRTELQVLVTPQVVSDTAE